ncbi:MAG TPA: hypothetical protein VFC82_02475 [Actinomycetaceae bacterium]|nr:hypothetical protein [Actinomycetaceae bacterium]
MLAIEGFRFGIEHEVAVRRAGRFCDFTNTPFEDLDQVLDELPLYAEDYPNLRVGDLGIKLKRWYIEGFERFDAGGGYLRTDPKGFEIRTPICESLDDAVSTLREDTALWQRAAERHGFVPLRTAINPYRSEFVPDPPLNPWELADRCSPEERTAHIHMVTYGPDISFSHPDLSTAETIEIGQKLTFASPFIVPFSFSSPFACGGEWGGLSRRTYVRTGPRPAVLVHVGSDDDVVPSSPTLTDRARIPAEVGRIEFKAFDCVTDFGLYRALGTLLLGLALDNTLTGRALVPDSDLHRRSAAAGFEDPATAEGAEAALRAASRALPGGERDHLEPLVAMLRDRRTPAHEMIRTFRATGSLMAAIS